MERLTDETHVYKDYEFLDDGMAQYMNRLAVYENTGLTPADIADLKNEHCLMCGKYKTAHMGSCDGCRWRKA